MHMYVTCACRCIYIYIYLYGPVSGVHSPPHMVWRVTSPPLLGPIHREKDGWTYAYRIHLQLPSGKLE